MEKSKQTPLGDAHNGKRVTLVETGTTKYLFKPRSACAQLAMEAFLSYLKKEGFPFVPACEHVLEVTEEGFRAAFVQAQPAQSKEDVRHFFRTSGALIFLAYLLGSSDLHCENLIAVRDKPVLVDCETMIGGKTQPSRYRSLSDSVLHSHLLPVWRIEADKAELFAGLLSQPPQQNMLFYGGLPAFMYDYEAEVSEGFEAAYTFAMLQREVMQKALSCFAGTHYRVLLRPTKVYAAFLRTAALFDEQKRDEALRTLLEAGLRSDVRENRVEQMRAATEKELAALVKGDIPYFALAYDSDNLYCGKEAVVQHFFSQTPACTIAERLEALSEDDLCAQKRIISLSLAAARPFCDTDDCKKIQSKKTFHRVAFEWLESGFISSLSSSFMQLYVPPKGAPCLQSAGYGLYEGLAGILCAYAALYYRTREPEYRKVLKQRYEPLHAFITSQQQVFDISLQNGAGGILAALKHLFTLTGDRLFLDDANLLASKISLQTLASAPAELLGGVNGLALALPALSAAVARPLAQAILPALCAVQPDLTGAAHGAAGIALGIAAAQKTLQTNAFDGKILELLRFENRYYDTAAQNWCDLRTRESGAFMHGWCSGAPGIAMCRKSLLSYTEHPEIEAICREDIAKAKENLLGEFTAKKDCLCCGNAARLAACSALGITNDALAECLQARVENGSYKLLHPLQTCDQSFSLMQGAAGLVYAVVMNGDENSGGMLC